jgi:hypothetical protein
MMASPKKKTPSERNPRSWGGGDHLINSDRLRKTTMPDLTLADALRLAINVLPDSAESRKMPSGVDLDNAAAELHASAADVLDDSLEQLRGHE